MNIFRPKGTDREMGGGPPGGRRVLPWSWGLLLALIIFPVVCLSGGAAWGAEAFLEDLHYSVDVLLWRDAARARITLKSLGGGKYLAEISGRPQGMLKTLSGSDREERMQTEMAWRQGRLQPLVYREESRRRGKLHLKEYRFDYDRGRLELWELKGEALVYKWHTTLTGPIYDPLSGFYNCRLGLLGPIQDGQVFKLKGIPYPKPEDIEVQVGPETPEGRKTMILIRGEAYKDKPAPVFAFFDPTMVPKHAWTRIWGFGKITGELLPGGKGLKGLKPEVAAHREVGAVPES